MVSQSLTPEKFRHVNDHLTPLAVLVVLPGVLLAALSRADVWLSVGLLAYAVLMNYVSVLVPSRNVQRLAKFRVGSNYVVNIALVWVLYRVWPSVWLLLLLMSVGPALYQSRRDATLTGVAVAVLCSRFTRCPGRTPRLRGRRRGSRPVRSSCSAYS